MLYTEGGRGEGGRGEGGREGGRGEEEREGEKGEGNRQQRGMKCVKFSPYSLSMFCLLPPPTKDHLAALMEVNEENETLLKQYDREKQRRKEIEDVSTVMMRTL